MTVGPPSRHRSSPMVSVTSSDGALEAADGYPEHFCDPPRTRECSDTE